MAARGAPNKPGLRYFPKMLDFYEDDRIFDLLDRYGPLGVTVYDCILCIVYRHGYYAEIPLDKLSKMITKMIGNKWVKNQKTVVQVVHFCSEIGLIDNDLMTENIITSVGIQRRYYEIAVKLMKRQLYSDKYWLLKDADSDEPLLNAPKKRITSEEKRINSEENRNTSELSHIKEKESKIKNNNIDSACFQNRELNDAFCLYITGRIRCGESLSDEQIKILKEELITLSDKDSERIAIAKKAFASGWKSFYPIGKGKAAKQKVKDNNNFERRQYDMEKLESQLLGK